MSGRGYFHRVQEETPTRFWINNPTLEQAKRALAEGAVGCTTNPSYVSKLFASPEDYRVVLRAIDLLVPYEPKDSVVAAKVQAAMVARLSDLFLPLFESSNGKAGFVTIQGDPFEETVAQRIVDEGVENRKIGPNIMVKIPVTESGIEAIRYFVDHDAATMATEVMGLSQAIAICEAYKAASTASGRRPVFYVTHITGILDDHFKRVIQAGNIALPEEMRKAAGLSIAKRQYALMKERGYPGTLIGGGARKLEDFTELVGGDLAITINWTDTADILLEKDGPVVRRIDERIDAAMVAELKERLPDYARAYEPDGMKPREFYDFGGVELFRSSFMKGWKALLALVAERRKAL